MKYSVHALSAALLTGGLLTGCLMGGGEAKEAKTVGLMTDQMVSPANVAARPSFSWRMESARTGAAQTAYQVKVFEGVAEPKEVWDSGEVADGRSVGVRYAGPELKSAAKYMWKVRVKDETGAWLEPAKGFFETGLFRKSDWNGSV